MDTSSRVRVGRGSQVREGMGAGGLAGWKVGGGGGGELARMAMWRSVSLRLRAILQVLVVPWGSLLVGAGWTSADAVLVWVRSCIVYCGRLLSVVE